MSEIFPLKPYVFLLSNYGGKYTFLTGTVKMLTRLEFVSHIKYDASAC